MLDGHKIAANLANQVSPEKKKRNLGLLSFVFPIAGSMLGLGLLEAHIIMWPVAIGIILTGLTIGVIAQWWLDNVKNKEKRTQRPDDPNDPRLRREVVQEKSLQKIPSLPAISDVMPARGNDVQAPPPNGYALSGAGQKRY